MKLKRRHKLILLVLGIGLMVMDGITAASICHSEVSMQRDRAKNITRAYSREISKDLNYSISTTDALDQLIVDNDGSTDGFELSAKMLLRDSVDYLAVAPGGVITASYATGESRISADDLVDLADAASVAEYADKSRDAVIYGPVDISDVGRRVIVINPVYLEGADNSEPWGYTVALIKVPDVYRGTLKTLRSLGYDYCLDATIRPDSEKSVQVESSMKKGVILDDPEGYSFEVGKCKWTMDVEPRGGWKSGRSVMIFVEGIAFTIALLGLTYLIIRIGLQEKEIRKRAYVDFLTELPNRGGFMDQMGQWIEKNPAGPGTVVFLDLDDFKIINDVYGHAAGDEVLISFASHIRASFPENTVFGRTGGDEFCALMPGKTAEECAPVIDQTIDEVQHLRMGKEEITYTVSAGYAEYPAQAHDRQQLLIMADEALYAAKAEGKNKAKHFEKKMSGIKREQMGFSARTIASGIPGAFMIYKADDDEQIVFANEDLINLFGCRNMDDFLEYTHSSFHHVVHPDDLDRVEEEIRHQIESQREDPEHRRDYYDDYVEYRIITRDGETVPVIDLGRLVYDDHYGEVFFVFIYRNEKVSKRVNGFEEN